MHFMTVEEAQAKLPELLCGLIPGDKLFITEGGRAIAELVTLPHAESRVEDRAGGGAEQGPWPCEPGTARGQVWMADDFDAPLEDFKEYME